LDCSTEGLTEEQRKKLDKEQKQRQFVEQKRRLQAFSAGAGAHTMSADSLIQSYLGSSVDTVRSRESKGGRDRQLGGPPGGGGVGGGGSSLKPSTGSEAKYLYFTVSTYLHMFCFISLLVENLALFSLNTFAIHCAIILCHICAIGI